MTNALSFIDVHKSFGATDILRGVNLDIEDGEIVAIIGPNGAGKSTLFDIATGRNTLGEGKRSGRIELFGQPIDGLRPYEIVRRGLSRSFQTSQLFGAMSCADNLRAAMLWSSGHRHSFWQRLTRLETVNRMVDEWLHELGLSKVANQNPSSLNYAQQRALELGLAVAGGSKIVLLDEPTAGMNREESKRFTELIRTVARNRTLVIVEHDMDVVFGLADRVAVLVDGQIIAFDSPSSVRANIDVQQAYLGSIENLLHADENSHGLHVTETRNALTDVSTYPP